MSLPISWVVAVAIPASQAAKQVANFTATSANLFFGELLQTSSQQTKLSAQGNGRLEPTEPPTPNQKASSEKKGWPERVESLRSHLSEVVSGFRARYPLPTDSVHAEGLSISATGEGEPFLEGPEPMRTELHQYLQRHPTLIHEINELASQCARSGPLRLLPQQDTVANSGDAWKLWIDG